MDKIQKEIEELVKKANPANPVFYVEDAVKGLALKHINACIRNCSICEDCRDNTRLETVGSPYAPILVVGERVLPEQTGKKSTVGLFQFTEEGRMLDDVFLRLGIDPAKLLKAALVNCSTYMEFNGIRKKRAPKSSEIKNCGLFLDSLIDSLKPLGILILGNIALNYFKPARMSEEHGRWFFIRDKIPAMAVYSPTFILDSRDGKSRELSEEYEAEFCMDIDKFFREMEKNHPECGKLHI